MQTRSVVRLSPLLVALALGGLPVLLACAQGCSSTPDDDTGSAEFIATTAQELTNADVTRVTITITGAGIATPITHDLVRVNGQWRGTIGAIPVGAERNFHGDAYDGSGVMVYRGDVPSVTISKGSTAVVSLLMQQAQAPNPFRNAAPRIDSTTASSNAVAPGEAVSLAATAHDPDGEPLAVTWSATGGTFTGAGSLSPQWTAPAAEGTYVLTMQATDPKGAVAATTFSVNVATSNGRGSASVTTTLNTWPEVALVNASPTRVDVGETTALSIVASDADNDALHFAWTASCAGSFDNAASQAPSFTLAAPLPPGNACALLATVTDNRGGTNTGEITITTGPAVPTGLAPIIDTTFQSAETAAAGEGVILRLAAHDPEGTAVSILWSADIGTLGTATNGTGTSEITWTSPSCRGGATPTVTATVTDATGLSTLATFAVQLTTTETCGSSPALAGGSCAGLHQAGVIADGTYWVDPAGTGPFQAQCDMARDGGGWTLLGRGKFIVTDDTLTDPDALLPAPKLTGIIGASSSLFRLGRGQRMFIRDTAALFEPTSDRWWRTNASSLECANNYTRVVNGTMIHATWTGVSCLDAQTVGSHQCGYQNGWGLWTNGETYNVSGSHPCAFGVSSHPTDGTVLDLYVR